MFKFHKTNLAIIFKVGNIVAFGSISLVVPKKNKNIFLNNMKNEDILQFQIRILLCYIIIQTWRDS